MLPFHNIANPWRVLGLEKGDKATAPNVHTQMKPGERKQRKDAEYIDTNVTEIVDLVLEAARRHYIGTLG